METEKMMDQIKDVYFEDARLFIKDIIIDSCSWRKHQCEIPNDVPIKITPAVNSPINRGGR